jgi:AraC family transcriptional regulator
MVCNRCIMTVENILQKNNITFNKVLIGEIYLDHPINNHQRESLQSDLESVGFEIISKHNK